MRLTEFWRLVHEEFGEMRGDSLARDQVFSSLQGRSAREALEAGTEPKVVWLAICDAYDVPVKRR
ncbi:MAG: DUF3046 domain-containing protein [Mycobacteriales bacterium]